jgi:predicted nucleic acid-binding protein
VDKDIEEKARKELLNFNDKLWSITDMTSFLLIQEYKIAYSLSFDRDFKQASHHFGFLDIRPYLSQER